MVALRMGRVRAAAFAALALPIPVFLFGWLRWYWALPAAGLLAAAAVLAVRGCARRGPEGPGGTEDDAFPISVRSLLLVALVALAWNYLAGQGCAFYQSRDHHWRNAIFRDLVTRDWPVVYEEPGAALVYYIAYWLVPAALGKLAAHVAGPGAGWAVGNVCLYAWSCALTALVALLFLAKVGARSPGRVAAGLLVLVMFSGLDIVGIFVRNDLDVSAVPAHLEWWANAYQYSSHTTQLFWVFNQSTPAWLGILLLLHERDVRRFALVGLLVLPYAPLPFIGLFPYFAALAARDGVAAARRGGLRAFALRAASPENVLAVVSLLPVYYLYYSSNLIASDHGFRFDAGASFFGAGGAAARYALFFALEAGVYLALLLPGSRRDLLYWTTAASLLLVGAFRLGQFADFSMRVSIPALMVLAVLVTRRLLDGVRAGVEGGRRFVRATPAAIALAVVLSIGAATPLVEYSRALHAVIAAGRLDLAADGMKTFEGKKLVDLQNFVAVGYRDSAFFTHLAR